MDKMVPAGERNSRVTWEWLSFTRSEKGFGLRSGLDGRGKTGHTLAAQAGSSDVCCGVKEQPWRKNCLDASWVSV